MNYTVIDTQEGLELLSKASAAASRVAIDMEADSLHHYFEKVCLLQVTCNGINYIVDPLAGLNLSPFFVVIASKPLLLHGADYDLRMMRRDFGFRAQNVFDTMIAAQLLGYERFSLAALIEKHFGYIVNKQGQKADWSKRPLSEKLLDYAATDTHYLEELANILRDELIAAGRIEWHAEVCEELLKQVENGMREVDEDRQWRIKGWHTLKSRRAQAILRELWRWRDTEAQRSDLPPYKILRNESLVELALWADSNTDYTTAPKLPRNCIGKRLSKLQQAIETGQNLPESEWPTPLSGGKRPTFSVEPAVKRMKKVRDEIAAAEALDPGVLVPTAAMAAIAVARPADIEELRATGALYDWQIKLLGKQLLEALVKPEVEPTGATPVDQEAEIASGQAELPGL